MSANDSRPLVTIGVNWYKDGIHILPYTFGVRMPYPNPADGSPDQTYDAGFEQGAYEGAWRVGLGGLVAGLALGYFLFRK